MQSLWRMVIALGIAVAFVSVAHYLGWSDFLSTVE
jgi:hypothetical protein